MSNPLFFISYRNISPDAEWAYWVAWQLESKYGEKSCIIQEWDFLPNANFIENMYQGALCEFTIAIASPNYFTSEYTSDEWTAAFHEKKLLLLEIAPCQNLGILSSLFRLSLYNFDKDQACVALFKHLERVIEFKKHGRMKPAAAPNFPQHSPIDANLKKRPCNLPFPISPHFVCSKQTWQHLEEIAISSTSNSMSRSVCVLHGLHGIGKTSLACAFAWRHLDKYSAVLWIRGGQKEVLQSSIDSLYDFDGLDLPAQKDHDHAERVRHFMKICGCIQAA